jgi:hypothetical protein
MRDPDCERARLGGNCDDGWFMFETELVRFIADDGMGIADELLFTGANVCRRGQKVRRRGATRWEAARQKAEGRRQKAGELTWRRTENMPDS